MTHPSGRKAATDKAPSAAQKNKQDKLAKALRQNLQRRKAAAKPEKTQ